MKKLMVAALVLGICQVGLLTALAKAKNVEVEELRIQNDTSKPIYLGVYIAEKGKAPEMFGDILTLHPGASSNELNRPKKPAGEVRLYYSYDITNMMPDLINGLFLTTNANCKKDTFCTNAAKGLFSKNNVFTIKSENLEIKKK